MSTTLCAAEPLKNQAVKLSISHPFEARLWYSAVRNTHTALLDSIALIYEALRLYYIWTCKWVSIYCVLCFVHRVRMKVSSHYVFGGLDKDHHVLFLCVSKWSACNTLYIHNHVKLLKTQTIADCFFFFVFCVILVHLSGYIVCCGTTATFSNSMEKSIHTTQIKDTDLSVQMLFSI